MEMSLTVVRLKKWTPQEYSIIELWRLKWPKEDTAHSAQISS